MKFSKDFTPEQVQEMVKRVFPKAENFYRFNNYNQFEVEGKLYNYYFVVSETCLDEDIKIYDNNENYVCSIVLQFAERT